MFDVKVKRPAMRITFAFGAGRGTVWGCFSLRYKLHMHVLERNIYGDSILRDIVVLHFENHPLATRPLYIDANARTHKTRSVTEYKLPEYTKLYCFYMPD